MPRVELAHRPRGLGVRAFDDLGFVENDDVPGQGAHDLDVAREHGVGGDHHMRRSDPGPARVPVQPMQDLHPQMRGELGQFRSPVADQAGRDHDQGRAVEPAFLVLDGDMGDRLRRLAQSHVVGEEAPEPVRP